MTKLDRRNFLRRSLAAGTALAAATASNRAGAAMTEQKVAPSSPLGLDLAKRCGATAEHATIKALLEAKLAARSDAPGSTLYETAQCPVCGCMIVAERQVD